MIIIIYLFNRGVRIKIHILSEAEQHPVHLLSA